MEVIGEEVDPPKEGKIGQVRWYGSDQVEERQVQRDHSLWMPMPTNDTLPMAKRKGVVPRSEDPVGIEGDLGLEDEERRSIGYIAVFW